MVSINRWQQNGHVFLSAASETWSSCGARLPLSERQIKATFQWRGHWELYTLKRRGAAAAAAAAAARGKQEKHEKKKKKKKKISFPHWGWQEGGGGGGGVVHGHLLDELKHWKSARRADQKHWQRTRKHVCVRVHLRLLLENAWVRYLCLDTESTISRLNFGEGVRCLRVTLGHSARAQRNTQRGALETGPCLEHNRTAAMATSGRCDKQTR